MEGGGEAGWKFDWTGEKLDNPAVALVQGWLLSQFRVQVCRTCVQQLSVHVVLHMHTLFWSHFSDWITTCFHLLHNIPVFLHVCISTYGNFLCVNVGIYNQIHMHMNEWLQNKKQALIPHSCAPYFPACMVPSYAYISLFSRSVHARFIRQDHLCFFFNAHIHSINLGSNLFIYLFTRSRYHSLLFFHLSPTIILASN